MLRALNMSLVRNTFGTHGKSIFSHNWQTSLISLGKVIIPLNRDAHIYRSVSLSRETIWGVSGVMGYIQNNYNNYRGCGTHFYIRSVSSNSLLLNYYGCISPCVGAHGRASCCSFQKVPLWKSPICVGCGRTVSGLYLAFMIIRTRMFRRCP